MRHWLEPMVCSFGSPEVSWPDQGWGEAATSQGLGLRLLEAMLGLVQSLSAGLWEQWFPRRVPTILTALIDLTSLETESSD